MEDHMNMYRTSYNRGHSLNRSQLRLQAVVIKLTTKYIYVPVTQIEASSCAHLAKDIKF